MTDEDRTTPDDYLLTQLLDASGATTVVAKTSAQVKTAAQTAASGATVVLIAAEAAWPGLHEVLSLHHAALPQQPSDHDPLVAVQDLPLVSGQRTAQLAKPGVLQRSADTITGWVHDQPVASIHAHGAGRILVIPGEVPAGGARSLAAWCAEVLGLAPAPSPLPEPHPAVPVITPGCSWDLSLLPPVTNANDPQFIRAAGHAARLLPAEVHDALVDFADQSNPAGAMLISGVPVGDVPATPEHPRMAAKPDLVSEFALLTVARRLGQPVGYAPEHGGDLVQNVSPTREGAARQLSTGSAVVLEYHTEAAFHNFRPRYLMLLCLRGDPSAQTTLCSVEAITARLTEHQRRVLAQPRFTTGIDESYTGIRSAARSLPRPVLWGAADQPRLWLDNDLMLGTDPEAQDCLEAAAHIARTHGSGVTLAAGDLLVVDNDRAVHGRSPFTPRFDGTDRWLQRSMVIPDHGAADGQRHGRIIATEFIRGIS